MTASRIRACGVFLALIALTFAPALRAQEVKTESRPESKPAENPFTIEIETPRLGVIDQGSSGTCWAFATTSFLESEITRQQHKTVDLSEMYFARMALLEKARRYVALEGAARWTEGGLSHDLPYIIRKYGCMPASAYTGLKSGATRHNHSELMRKLGAMLKDIAKPDAKPPANWEDSMMELVDASLGAAPKSFEYEGKQYTARSFADEVVKVKPDDCVEVMSSGEFPFHEPAELYVPDNWLRYQNYINVPVDELSSTMAQAVRNGYSVAVDLDVSEPGFRQGRGVAKLPKNLERDGAVSQEVRDAMFKAKETTDDHLVHVVGIAHDKDGGIFYLTKNSWGEKAGPFGGYIYISANYMRAKALAIMVHKDALKKQA